jgi:hypothetical protein
MDNADKLATLGTQNTGRRQIKQKHNTDNKKKSNTDRQQNEEQHGPTKKPGIIHEYNDFRY